MNLNGDPSSKNPWSSAFNMKTLTVGGEVGCLTLIIVLAAVFGGLWLDNFFGTKPMITVIMVLASAPLSLVLTFWIAMRAVRNISSPTIRSVNSKTDHLNTEGEDKQ